jgi:hypothetical protein
MNLYSALIQALFQKHVWRQQLVPAMGCAVDIEEAIAQKMAGWRVQIYCDTVSSAQSSPSDWMFRLCPLNKSDESLVLLLYTSRRARGQLREGL